MHAQNDTPKHPITAMTETNERSENEDSYFYCQFWPGIQAPIQEPIWFLALSDGMGGLSHGADVSSETLRKIAMVLFDRFCVDASLNHSTQRDSSSPSPVLESDDDSVQSWLQRGLNTAILEADAHVRRMVKVNNWEKSGCTIVAALIWGKMAVITNLGDSPLFHFNAQTRQLIQITESHNEAALQVKAGLIDATEARTSPGKSILYQCIGVGEPVENLKFYYLPLQSGDKLMLCSDGAIGDYSDEELESQIGSEDVPALLLLKELFQLVRKRGESDNQTAILYEHP